MLSLELFREVRSEFLRLLGSPEARIYVDAADALEVESTLRSGALPREEAIAIAERVVEQHAEVDIEEASGLEIRERAHLVLERLLAARWLQAEDRADYQRFVLVEPNAAIVLEALRKIARPGAAVFSDKLSLRNSRGDYLDLRRASSCRRVFSISSAMSLSLGRTVRYSVARILLGKPSSA